MAAGLLLFAVVLSLVALPLEFLGMLGIYVLVNLLYSFWLKRKFVLDVMLLAGMYALRVLVGGVAAEIEVSEWLLAFSIFLFTSLAFAKRHAELARHAEEQAGEAPRGRGYGVGDLSMIESIGPTAGYMAVLVLALYINSPEMKVLVYASVGVVDDLSVDVVLGDADLVHREAGGAGRRPGGVCAAGQSESGDWVVGVVVVGDRDEVGQE